jgi:hypothetical protein
MKSISEHLYMYIYKCIYKSNTDGVKEICAALAEKIQAFGGIYLHIYIGYVYTAMRANMACMKI